MPASSYTKWGNTIQGSSTSRQGCIGIYPSITKDETTKVTVTVQVWFWSKYALSDSTNTWYYNEGSSATTSRGAKAINHTYNSGSGWDSSNQTLLGTFTHEYPKGTSATTKYFSAKIYGLENLGTSNISSVTASITVPKLSTYTIVYNANGGTGTMANTVVTYGVTSYLRSNAFSRSGYSFKGWNAYRHSDGLWYYSNANDDRAWYKQGSQANGYSLFLYADGGSTAKTSSVDGDTITMYAQWTPNTYTITFNANGGSGGATTQTKTHGTDLTLSSSVPTRTNYTFKGWSTYSTATTPTYLAGGKFTTNANTTLYAVWELNYQKPRITNVSIWRCDASGNYVDDGEYAKITFTWAVDKTNPKYAVYYKASTSSTYSGGVQVTLSGSTGTVTAIVRDTSGNHKFSTEDSFDIKLNVADDNGYTSAYTVLNSVLIPIDLTSDGKSMGLGSPATGVHNLKIGYKTMDCEARSTFPKGSYIHRATQPYGTAGYTKIARITIGNAYVNACIQIKVIKRYYEPTTYNIMFKSDAGSDPTVYTFYHDPYQPAYLVKATTSTWDLYISKVAYDDITVVDYSLPVYLEEYNRITLTWMDEGVATLPSGYIASTNATLLWSGSSVFNEGSAVTLSRPVSEQKKGLLFVFARNGDYNFSTHFVSKELIALKPSGTHTFLLATSLFDYIGVKTLYITDTTVTGHTDNDATGKNATSGITYHNEQFYLRYIFGV